MTWKPYNTGKILLEEISKFNKKKDTKKQILMSWTLRGFVALRDISINFGNKKTFRIKYHHGKTFFQKVKELFKEDEGYYEIYTEQENF